MINVTSIFMLLTSGLISNSYFAKCNFTLSYPNVTVVSLFNVTFEDHHVQHLNFINLSILLLWVRLLNYWQRRKTFLIPLLLCDIFLLSSGYIRCSIDTRNAIIEQYSIVHLGCIALNLQIWSHLTIYSYFSLFD